MGLTSSLSIGRSALNAYQAALNVVGQNVANAGTPGYTRASARLAAIPGPGLTSGQLGAGVRIDAVRRHVSESLNGRLRLAGSDQQSATAQRTSFSRIESIYDPLGEFNLGSLLGKFFESLNTLQNTPENPATRGIVISNAQALTRRIGDIREQLVSLRTDLNTDIQDAVGQADQLATKIAELNVRIATAEASSGGTAAGLRDERDRLLGELATFVNVTTREQPSGAVNVYIGSSALIQFGESFGMHVVEETNSAGLKVAAVRFKHDNGPVNASSGSIAGLITARDTHTQGQLDRLDALAGALISEVNRIHASGQGLSGFSSVSGLTAVLDPSLPLSTADNGIAFPPRTGSFFVDVRDNSTGAVVRTQINIDLDGIGADTSLNSLAADINANVSNLSATVLADGRLQLTATSGYSFTFADDTSHALAALGVNTFFAGEDALTIDVNPLVSGNPGFIAAARSGLSGDGSNATALAALGDTAVASLGGVSLSAYYNSTVADIAVSSSSAQSALDASSIILDSLTAQREAVSGVSLDEEAVSLISFQRAYEGAARYMRVVDEMLQELLTLVR